MTIKFFKEYRLIVFCKARLPDGRQCSKELRVLVNSVRAKVGLCYTHRCEFFRKRWRTVEKLRIAASPAARESERRRWTLWVIRNLDRRQRQALKSYHLNKDK